MKDHFLKFREGIIGIDLKMDCPDGKKRPVIYADWVASGRLYGPIEDRLREEIMPLVANTHTETSTTGMAMTHAYHAAQDKIKDHVNASNKDVIITRSSGMTGLVNKFQHMMGLKANKDLNILPKEEKCPVVFITHMEHHSNHTSWLETLATVEIIPPTEDGLVDVSALEKLLEQYHEREIKIASISACSNVTGISSPSRASISSRYLCSPQGLVQSTVPPPGLTGTFRV